MKGLLVRLVGLFPRAFREAFGPAMIEQIERDYERARARSRLRACMFTLATATDLVRSALAERWRPSGPPYRSRSRRWRPAGGALSWLDVKLGVRMLVRYPGLTALGGLAIAFAIFAGAGTFEFLAQVAHPSLPFDDGDRMVGVQLWDGRAGDDQGQALFDLGVWQEELTTIEELGAFATVLRNLIVGEGGARPVTGAVMHAAGFRITGVEPLLGLSLGGIYSVMSFTLARRTREIGVRVALGAPKRRIVLSVFRRPLLQVGLGLLAGGAVCAFLLGLDFQISAREVGGFLLYLALMTAVCLLACVVPTRRALAVEPADALRFE